MKNKNPTKQSKGNLREIPFKESTLEMIDGSLLDYIRQLGLHTETSSGSKTVPVLWSTTERSYQVKHDPQLRDGKDSLILPLISVERTSVTKDPTRKGTAWGNVPEAFDEKGGSIAIARRINQDKTANFRNSQAKNKRGVINFPSKREKWKDRVVYETITAPMPVYVEMIYMVRIRTEYELQMNDLMTPFITKPGGVNYILLKSEHGHTYEGFIDSQFEQVKNPSSLEESERIFERAVTIKVLGHLIGEGKNRDKPKIAVRENAVDVRIPREQAIFGDIPDHAQEDDFGYRE